MGIYVMLIGAPGSGKGTQAKFIKDQKDCVHISTGDLLREAIKDGTDLGRKAKEYTDLGKLVPDELIINLVKEVIAKLSREQGFILDGFPRTIAQAESLDVMLDELNISLNAVIYMDISKEEVIRRMAGRLTCKVCGRSYHRLFNPPKQEYVCDEDDSVLVVREDDREEIVMGRFDTFLKQTQPLIDYYEKKGWLKTVSAEQAIEKITEEILYILK